MKYVALLRGINVGGNSLIKMADIRKADEGCGYTKVATYIASGNVLFESDELNLEKITYTLENCLLNTFDLPVRVVVLSSPQYKKIMSDVPKDWEIREDIRKYMAFIKPPVSAKTIAPEVQLKKGVDFLKVGDGVLYMTTLLSGLTKSGFNKMAGNKQLYKEMTIRNYNTAKKILSLLEQD